MCLRWRIARPAMGRAAVVHGAVADEHTVGVGTRMNEWPRCCVERRVDNDEEVMIHFSIYERDGEIGPLLRRRIRTRVTDG